MSGVVSDMSEYPQGRKDKSTAVRIPKGLVNELEDFLKTDYAEKKGYHHKSDVVSDAVRELLEEHQPRFEHVNTFVDHAKIVDYQLKRIVSIYFKDDGTVWCDVDEAQSCPHIDYALSLDKVQTALQERGWKRKNSESKQGDE